MVRIPIFKGIHPDKHWLVDINKDGQHKHVGLLGCACSFENVVGYMSSDSLRAVSRHYEEDGNLYYELFNIGRSVFLTSIKLGLIRKLGYLLSGKEHETAHKEILSTFETALHLSGWKTVNWEGTRL